MSAVTTSREMHSGSKLPRPHQSGSEKAHDDSNGSGTPCFSPSPPKSSRSVPFCLTSSGKPSLSHSQPDHPWNLLISLSLFCAPAVSWTFSCRELPHLIMFTCFQDLLLLMDPCLLQRVDMLYLLHIPSCQPNAALSTEGISDPSHFPLNSEKPAHPRSPSSRAPEPGFRPRFVLI